MTTALTGTGRTHRSHLALAIPALTTLVVSVAVGCRPSASIVGVWRSTRVGMEHTDVYYRFDDKGQYTFGVDATSNSKFKSIHVVDQGKYQLSGTELVLTEWTSLIEEVHSDGTKETSSSVPADMPRKLVYPKILVSGTTLDLGALQGDPKEFAVQTLHRAK